MTEVLDGLSEEQSKVVRDTTGVRFVVACPGSGKTRTLVHSIVYLVEHEKVKPHRICAFTFTKVATREMRSRLEDMLDPVKASLLDISTMHSLFFRLFRENMHHWPRWHTVEVLDERRGGKRRLLGQAVKNLNIVEDDFDFGETRRRISFLKNHEVSPDSAEAYLQEAEFPHSSLVARVYAEYEKLKFAEKQIDFDDMLYMTNEMFKKAPASLETCQELYDYVFVDEFHDTSPVQNTLITRLIAKSQNLLCLCDPNQSIYGFRGAAPEIVLMYKEYYPEARLLKLRQNFRSRREIVEKCYRLIHHNPDPLKLSSYTEKEGGEVVFMGQYDDVATEACAVVDHISTSLEVRAFRDLMILYRTNAQSRAIEEELIRRGFPYRIEGSSNFYKRKEIQDILAYLDIALHFQPHSEAFERIFNRPNRFLGRAWYQEFMSRIDSGDSMTEALAKPFSRSYMTRGANRLRRELISIQAEHDDDAELDLVEFCKMILRTTLYRDWMHSVDEQANERLDNLDEFIESIGRFDGIQKLFSYIQLVTESLKKAELVKDKITLMTIHKAKGTESKVVYLLGVTEGLLPHALSHNRLEEERRLCFVAISRGGEEVYLSSIENYRNQQHRPSRFLVELGLISEQDWEEQDVGPHSGTGVSVQDNGTDSRDKEVPIRTP